MGQLQGKRQQFYDEDFNAGVAVSQAMGKKIGQAAQFINDKQLMQLEFGAIGPYDIAAGYPLYTAARPLEFNYEVYNLWATNGVVGASGQTEFDLEVKPANFGSWASILSQTGIFGSSSANDSIVDTRGVIASSPTGVTRPVFSNINLTAGYLMRMKLVSGMIGGRNLKLFLNIRPR